MEAQAHLQKLYTDSKYCVTLLKVPHTLFVKYLATISHHVVEEFPDLEQVLVITLDYVRNNGNLTDTYWRTKVAPPGRSPIPAMFKILTDINASIANVINRPSLEQVLCDELSFAANGYAGAVMSLDFKEVIVRGVRMYLLLGCDLNGHLRYFEILEAKTELAALHKSEFLSNLCKGVLPIPPSFEMQIGTGAHFGRPADHARSPKFYQ